jgi:hypothetical protein
MKLRPLVFAAQVLLITAVLHADPPIQFFKLPAEPLIRIGLLTNASSVAITTSDTELVAFFDGRTTAISWQLTGSCIGTSLPAADVRTYIFRNSKYTQRKRMRTDR